MLGRRDLGNQFLVFKSLRTNQFQHSIAEKIRILSVVEALLELVQVGVQVLCADFVPGAASFGV